MNGRIYLDHNATSPLRPEARAAMNRALDLPGNPSSIHGEGRVARALLEAARAQVAALVACVPSDVVFTSGGTEALNMVLTPEVGGPEGGSEVLLIAGGEHAAVFEGHRFAPDQTATVALDSNGRLDLAALEMVLAAHEGRRVMLAVQAANNETGVIQPVAEAAAMVHAHGGLVVCDAVQAAGKIDCRASAFGADAVAISAHKFGGPKGVGALIFAASGTYLRHGVVRGGGQERGLRSGTENLAGIAGMGAAAEIAARHWRDAMARLTALRTAIEAIVRHSAPGARIFGEGAPRLPNTVSFAVPGIAAQTLLMNLDLAGVAVSSGSACSSGKVKPSRVLEAMGVEPGLAKAQLRVSLGWTSRDTDITGFATAFDLALKNMRIRDRGAAA